MHSQKRIHSEVSKVYYFFFVSQNISQRTEHDINDEGNVINDVTVRPKKII